MSRFDHRTLGSIKDIFEEKTGVTVHRKLHRHPMKTLLVAVVLLVCCFSMTVFADTMFNGLAGDDLGFHTTYLGDGLIEIQVENRSDKVLRFQNKLKLMQWNSAKEVLPHSDAVEMSGTTIDPHSVGIMTVDLSAAYHIETLELPLENDHYYLVLTNNNFLFGHDWMCSVDFCERVEYASADITQEPDVQTDAQIVAQMEEEIRDYFEIITFDIKQRTLLAGDYATDCRALFDARGISVLTPAEPHLVLDDTKKIFDETVPEDQQHLLIGQHYRSADWKFKMLGFDFTHSALTVSVDVPLKNNPDWGTYIPIAYFFVYDKNEIQSEDDWIFVYGQLMQLRDIAEHKVYEDDRYVCYELTWAIYSDLEELVNGYAAFDDRVLLNESVWKRIESVYEFYTTNDNLKDAFYYAG